jgi:hypothetical protein
VDVALALAAAFFFALGLVLQEKAAVDRRGGGDNDGVRPAIEPRVRIGLFDESLHEGLLGYVAAAALLGVTLCGLVIVARAKGAKPPPEPAPVPAHA